MPEKSSTHRIQCRIFLHPAALFFVVYTRGGALSLIGNSTLYDPQIMGYFVFLTVILRLLKFFKTLRKIALCKRASSIAGVAQRTSFFFFFFFEEVPGPTIGGPGRFFQAKKKKNSPLSVASYKTTIRCMHSRNLSLMLFDSRLIKFLLKLKLNFIEESISYLTCYLI